MQPVMMGFVAAFCLGGNSGEGSCGSGREVAATGKIQPDVYCL